MHRHLYMSVPLVCDRSGLCARRPFSLILTGFMKDQIASLGYIRGYIVSFSFEEIYLRCDLQSLWRN